MKWIVSIFTFIVGLGIGFYFSADIFKQEKKENIQSNLLPENKHTDYVIKQVFNVDKAVVKKRFLTRKIETYGELDFPESSL